MMAGKIITEKLLSIHNSITGVENNPDIQKLLGVYGYTPERMEEGKKLIETLNHLITIQEEDSDSRFSEFWKSVYSAYMITLKIVRIAFIEHPEMLQQFHATGKRNRSLSGWLHDSTALYTNLLNSPEGLEMMFLYGYTAEKLNKEFQEVIKVEQLHNKHLNEKGTTRQPTLERDKSFDALCKWYSKFRAVARIALYKKPELFEEIITND
jgi:hypothetical protein